VTDELPEHARENRRYWDAYAPQWVAAGERAWRADEPPGWGSWEIPETELQLLPAEMRGMHAIELGCGTAYVSCWMARRGARVVGIDNSEQQLATARRLAAEHAITLTLLHGSAERVPYPDASFDFAVSEYGAATWCDPYAWIPEAHRLLKPGGGLSFLGNAPLASICTPPSGDKVERTLHHDYFALHRRDWRQAEIEPGGIEFNLPLSKWLRLFRDTGFELCDYHELQAPAGAPTRHSTPGEWAHRWPSEHAFVLRKR
jgi:SAM-dependent methyltransferase